MSGILFRNMEEGDINYMLSSFLNSYLCFGYNNLIPTQHYNKFYSALLNDLIDSDKTTVSIAVNPNNPAEIFSWCIIESGDVPIIHYTYTKLAYRQLGISKSLMQTAGINFDEAFFYTFSTPSWDKVRRCYKKSAVYNPLLILQTKV